MNTEKPAPFSPAFFERSRVVAAVIFVVTVASIAAISFVGVTQIDIPVLPGQVATTRVVASTSFTYQSRERTAAANELAVRRLPPVYKLDLTGVDKFELNIRNLIVQLED